MIEMPFWAAWARMSLQFNCYIHLTIKISKINMEM